jgi:hypothetical protein
MTIDPLPGVSKLRIRYTVLGQNRHKNKTQDGTNRENTAQQPKLIRKAESAREIDAKERSAHECHAAPESERRITRPKSGNRGKSHQKKQQFVPTDYTLESLATSLHKNQSGEVDQRPNCLHESADDPFAYRVFTAQQACESTGSQQEHENREKALASLRRSGPDQLTARIHSE